MVVVAVVEVVYGVTHLHMKDMGISTQKEGRVVATTIHAIPVVVATEEVVAVA